jgi:hypothetical protein
MSDIASDLPIVVKQPFARIVLSLFGSAIVTCVAAYASFEGAPAWIAWLVAIVFGVCALYFAEKLLNPKARLVISADGIHIDFWKSEMAWNDFVAAEARAVGKDVYLCLELRDPEGYRRGISPALRAIHTATRETGFGDLSIRISDYFSDTTPVIGIVRRLINSAKANPKSASSVRYPCAD